MKQVSTVSPGPTLNDRVLIVEELVTVRVMTMLSGVCVFLHFT